MLYPVIICGGQGARLWPLSRINKPKHTIKLESDSTLFQQTLRRLEGVAGLAPPLIVANVSQRRLLEAELLQAGICEATLILEPTAKNTAAAFALAALHIQQRDPKAKMLVMAADAKIENEAIFRLFLSHIVSNHEQINQFILASSKPTDASPFYGYIKLSEEPRNFGDGVSAHKIEEFIEKPTTPQKYFDDGYYWNTCIGVYPVDVLLREFENHCQEILSVCQSSLPKKNSISATNAFKIYSVKKAPFSSCPELPIEPALLQKTNKAFAVKLDFGWADIGSYSSLYNFAPKDQYGNAISGDEIISINNRNTQIISKDPTRMLAAVNVNDLTIVQTEDSVLVMNSNAASEIRTVNRLLQSQNKYKYLKHPENFKSWGVTRLVKDNPLYKIKNLTIKPFATVNLRGSNKNKLLIVEEGEVRIKLSEHSFKVLKNGNYLVPPNVEYSITNLSDIEVKVVKIKY